MINSFFTKSLVPALLCMLLLPTMSCNSDNVIFSDEPETENPKPDDEPGDNPANSGNQAYANKVYEWMPAPGQFINDETGGVEWPDNMTAEQACERALEKLNKQYTVSLGAFGGYIVVGFDHHIFATQNDYEIGVLGNAFESASGSSNEPGIVYVMKDANGNGLPDDVWYELCGSDTFSESTIRDYEVTYYRPEGPQQSVHWEDNQGEQGEIKYIGTFHSQPTYYPVWIKEKQYTLSGTRVKSRTFFNSETGNWSNPAFDWGYADNRGSDNIEFMLPNCNRFKISNAIDANGNSVKLDYIDFVKIQTGVNASAGHLGEISTEILGVLDLTFKAESLK